MLKDLIVGILEGIARVAQISREAFGKQIEEIGQQIRNGALMADEAFGRAKADAATLDKLYSKRKTTKKARRGPTK
jgi:hypothetical protein